MVKGSEQALAKAREWKRKNQDKVKASRKAYYDKNKEQERIQKKEWQTNNKDKKAASDKRYRQKHAEKIKQNIRSNYPRLREKQRERYRTDPEYRLKMCLRAGFTQSLRLQDAEKHTSVSKLIGCTMAELKTYLSSKFVEGMSWDNHGKWHIDHVRPVSSFSMADASQRAKCWHFSNLQPLWAKDNLSKSNFWDGVTRELEKPAESDDDDFESDDGNFK